MPSSEPLPSDDAVQSYWIKQSEMLQGAINRMANNSLEVKKFGATVWTAITGFGVTNSNSWFFALALASVFVFGVLDLYYLFLERKFRQNYNRLAKIISGYGTVDDHQWAADIRGNFMKPDSSVKFLPELPSTLRSWANLPYLIMLSVTVTLFLIDFSAHPAP
ncbi:MAG: hypothetical protein AAFX78_09285 [Cyanobacteria bacterium J06638_20]